MHKGLEAGLDQLVEDSRSLWVPYRIREYNTKGHAIQFLRDHIAQSVPCVWRGAATSWPALTKWNLQSQSYLRDKIGDRVVDVAWTPNGRADSIVDIVSSDDAPRMVFAMPQLRKQKLGDMLSQLRSDETSWRLNRADNLNDTTELGVPYYSAQDSSLTRDVPELLEDIDESVIEFATEAFGEEASATNIWCGDGRSVTTMHADPFENMYAVVTGVKIFRLRPPCDAAMLCKPTLRRARWKTVEEDDGSATEHILRTKTDYKGWRLVLEDGETSWIDESKIDERCGRELVVRVEAGDLLYLPALWYAFCGDCGKISVHHVSQCGLTIAVNWWFEMNFGRDWVYRELCFNLHKAMSWSKEVTEDDHCDKEKQLASDDMHPKDLASHPM